MIFQYVAKRTTWLVPFAVLASTLLALPVQGQEPPPQPGEVKMVVRISKQLIEDVVTRKEVVASIPYCDAIVLGFRCEGVIDGKGKLSVEMTTEQGQGTFIVSSQGTAQTYARGVRGPIVAMGPAWGPFASQTLVRFDGRKFAMVQTTPWAQVHGELERVEGRHGGSSWTCRRPIAPSGGPAPGAARGSRSHADWRVLPQELRGRTGRKDCHEVEPHHPCGTIAESALSRDHGLGFSTVHGF
jgi:hypothetical protein